MEVARFFQDPFKCVQDLLEDRKSGKFFWSNIWSNFGARTEGTNREHPTLTSWAHSAEPASQFDTTPPRCTEIKQVVDKARSASAPGLKGDPYKVCKNCPMVLELLCKLMSLLEEPSRPI